ncbi:hypothetical protein K504DRAFT_484547 [Pleomassaria siparia CBS 279.74]|uniref:U6 snRNA phosphodiesterase n=1 Tax=Pleomassaria siparia CBS 279.74 TaxID=1314801 RepID=A0A6G1JX40_9PLEO|nr:hypothetical protein K504DRAFT_484547 [Pleomassaria siparia CBS 279.74]
MSLVQYPDSDDEDDNHDDNHDDGDDDDNVAHDIDKTPAQLISNPAVKRKRDDCAESDLPPLPAAFHDLYSSNARTATTDDPSLHGGRKRAIPHVEGNWPSHVYLEWVPLHAESQALFTLIQSIQETIVRANKTRQKPLPVPDITPSLRSPLGAPLPLHVSLSRTLQIKTDDRENFVETLTSSLSKAAIRPFNIRFGTLKWVSNYQRNRWFLVLGIAKPAQDELNGLLNACNNATEKCGHPGLYTGGNGDGPMPDNKARDCATKRNDQNTADDSLDRTENFHVSIAWNLGEPDPEWIALLGTIDLTKHLQAPEAPFDAVKVKVGNVVHNIELSARKGRAQKRAGILGLG